MNAALSGIVHKLKLLDVIVEVLLKNDYCSELVIIIDNPCNIATVLTCLSGGGHDGSALLPPAHVVHRQHPELVLRVRAENIFQLYKIFLGVCK